MEIVTGVLFVAYFVTHNEVISPRLAMIMNTLVFLVVLTVNVWKNLSTLGVVSRDGLKLRGFLVKS